MNGEWGDLEDPSCQRETEPLGSQAALGMSLLQGKYCHLPKVCLAGYEDPIIELSCVTCHWERTGSSVYKHVHVAGMTGNVTPEGGHRGL